MPVATKACSICEIDLNGQKRVKDPCGNYYCPACWEARVKAARASAREKILIGAVVVISLGMTALTAFYIHSQGYTFGL